MINEPDPLEERLRRLRLADPDPALRWRTLHGAREVLERRSAAAGWWTWLRSWRLEAALAAAVVVCLLLLPWLSRTFDPPSIPPYDQGGRPRPSQGHGDGRQPGKPAADPEMVTQLELDEALQPYVRFRLAVSQRDRETERRYQFHEARRILARGEV